MANDWYYLKNDQQLGPVPREKLAQLLAAGELARDDLVWTDGMADWAPAGQVPGLAPAGPAARTAAPRPTAARPAAQPALAAAPPPEEYDEEEYTEGLSAGAKIGIIAGCAGGVMLLLIIFLVMRNWGGRPAPAQTGSKPSSSSSSSSTKKDPPPPVTLVDVAFDASTLTDPMELKWYHEGKKKGERDVDEYVAGFSKGRPSDDAIRTQVNQWLEERRLAIHTNCRRKERDRDAFVAFGRRDGMKAAIARHKLPGG